MVRIWHRACRKETVLFVSAQSVPATPVYRDLWIMLFLRIIQKPCFSTVRVCKVDVPSDWTPKYSYMAFKKQNLWEEHRTAVTSAAGSCYPLHLLQNTSGRQGTGKWVLMNLCNTALKWWQVNTQVQSKLSACKTKIKARALEVPNIASTLNFLRNVTVQENWFILIQSLELHLIFGQLPIKPHFNQWFDSHLSLLKMAITTRAINLKLAVQK